MKPEPPEEKKDFGEDLKTFEALPAKTKALVLLKDQAEKATGPESATLNQKIRAKARAD
jgi:hypothetical protein